jgi:hypothetical protein
MSQSTAYADPDGESVEALPVCGTFIPKWSDPEQCARCGNAKSRH